MTVAKMQNHGPIPKRSAYKRRVVDSNKSLAAKLRFAAIGRLPCSLYLNWAPECFGRTTVAHKDGAGMAMKAPYHQTFACCEGHHLFGRNSITNMGAKAWQRKYGQQDYLIELTDYRLGLLDREPRVPQDSPHDPQKS